MNSMNSMTMTNSSSSFEEADPTCVFSLSAYLSASLSHRVTRAPSQRQAAATTRERDSKELPDLPFLRLLTQSPNPKNQVAVTPFEQPRPHRPSHRPNPRRPLLRRHHRSSCLRVRFILPPSLTFTPRKMMKMTNSKKTKNPGFISTLPLVLRRRVAPPSVFVAPQSSPTPYL